MTPERRESDTERKKRKRQEYRDACQAHYGGVCQHCGSEGRLGFNMQLDHKNDDGADHRRELKEAGLLPGDGGWHFYRWLVQNDYPDERPIWLLCEDCHRSKPEWYTGGRT